MHALYKPRQKVWSAIIKPGSQTSTSITVIGPTKVRALLFIMEYGPNMFAAATTVLLLLINYAVTTAGSLVTRN